MTSRNRNVLLGAIATCAFALSLLGAQIAGNCLRHGCDGSLPGSIPVATIAVGIALIIFYTGATIGRIRSGWLAALFLCSSAGWMAIRDLSLLSALLIAATSAAGSFALGRPVARASIFPSATRVPLAIGSALLLAFSDQALEGLFPWFFLALAVALWSRTDLTRTSHLDFLIDWILISVWVGYLVGHFATEAPPSTIVLPAIPPLALAAGLTVGPGPEGQLPRRLLRLNLELIAAAGLLVAFLVLTAMVAPIETVLPDNMLHFWNDRFAGLRVRGTLTMILAFAILGLSTAIILQARGAHWFRASIPLALLLPLLHLLLA